MSPRNNGLQTAFHESRFAESPLDLSARSFRNAAGLEQHDRERLQLMTFRNCHSNPGNDLVRIEVLSLIYLLNDYQLLFAARFDGKSGPASRSQRAIALLDGTFDILRVMVEPSYDDEIFQPSRYEQLTVLSKTEIPGSKEWAFIYCGRVSH